MIQLAKRRDQIRKISIFNGADGLVFSAADVRSMFCTLDSSKFRISDGELSIAFLDSESMCAIHGKFLGDATPTDVITFSGDGEMDFAGEICVSPSAAVGNHRFLETTFSEELSLYLVHGYLHIFGLNDACEKETIKMRAGENFCMALLKDTENLPNFSYDHLRSCKAQRHDYSSF
ncbi:MAG: rRNA maturation RNase YbeY [Puniceicoccales bacterium]|jgi:probable rRNA maturation factor|nr:rRNA maturation RNase YbeY [Puniceicoccales bacterium]